MRKKKIFITIFLTLFGVYTHAQTFEIRAVNKGNGTIGVELRDISTSPPTTTNNVTDIVFGLKWLSIYNVELVNTINTNYHIIKSDTRKTKNGFYFQAFSASNTPFLIPSNWGNNWIEIMNIANTKDGVDTGTFQICETGFDNTTDPNFGLDLTDFTPTINGSAFGVVLPLILTRFDVSAQKNLIRLSWSTSSEMNNKGFEIERSIKETSQFDSVGWVKGMGYSNLTNNYEFLDKQVTQGVEYFYRLKQTDFDGKFGFSETKVGIIEGRDNAAFKISPNPATSLLHLLFLGSKINGKIKLRIIDAKGSSTMELYTTFISGGKVDVNVSLLSPGQYFLVVEQNGNLIYQKPFQKA